MNAAKYVSGIWQIEKKSMYQGIESSLINVLG